MGRHTLDISIFTDTLSQYTSRVAFVDNDVHGHQTIRDEKENASELQVLKKRQDDRRIQTIQDKTEDMSRSTISRDEQGLCKDMKTRNVEEFCLRRCNDRRPYDENCTPAPEVEEYLREADIGRFDSRPFRLDIDPVRYVDDVTTAEEAEEVLQTLAHEMKTKGTPLYHLMEEFKRRDDGGIGGERKKRAQDHFCAIANAISKRLWERDPSSTGSGKVPYRNVFLSMGETYVKGSTVEQSHLGPKPQNFPYHERTTPLSKEEYEVALGKPDIILDFLGDEPVDQNNPLWKLIAGVGEVKADQNKDLLMSTIFQIQRYLINLIKHHPLVGEVLCFGLSGPILRGHSLASHRFSTSRGFNLEDPEDYLDIVKMIALFSGPVGNFMPSWGPKKGETLTIRPSNGEEVKVKLMEVWILESRFNHYGRRTTVFGADFGILCGRLDVKPGEILVIKASWMLPRLAEWEMKVYKHIQTEEAQRLSISGIERDPDIGLPEFVGELVDADHTKSLGPHKLGYWETREAPKRDATGKVMEKAVATIFVTKCFRAHDVYRSELSLLQVIKIYRKLFKTLKYLADIGVHYRDLNLGNILCDSATGTRCLLIDFDFARLHSSRRGEPEEDQEFQLPRMQKQEEEQKEEEQHKWKRKQKQKQKRTQTQNSDQKRDQERVDKQEQKRQSDESWDISIDDAISGNPFFQSRHVHAASKLHEKFVEALYKKSQAEVELARQTENTDPNPKAILLSQLQYGTSCQKVDKLVDQLKEHRHCYLDDCESALYTKIRTVAALKSEETLYALWRLDDYDHKEDIWENGFIAVTKHMGTGLAWPLMLEQLRLLIGSAQTKMEQVPDPEQTPGLHPFEKECFEQCIELMGETIADLEEKPIVPALKDSSVLDSSL